MSTVSHAVSYLNAPRCKFHPDGRFWFQIKFVAGESRQKVTLPDAGVPDQDNCKRRLNNRATDTQKLSFAQLSYGLFCSFHSAHYTRTVNVRERGEELCDATRRPRVGLASVLEPRRNEKSRRPYLWISSRTRRLCSPSWQDSGGLGETRRTRNAKFTTRGSTSGVNQTAQSSRHGVERNATRVFFLWRLKVADKVVWRFAVFQNRMDWEVNLLSRFEIEP